MTRRIPLVVALLATIVLGSPARAEPAEPEWECGKFAALLSQGLFPDAGFYSTKGPTFLAIPECAHKPTGIFGQALIIGPIERFKDGAEIDPRLGWRFEKDGFGFDVSASHYVYRYAQFGGTRNIANARGRVSRKMPIDERTKLTLFVETDYQHIFHDHKERLGLGGGAQLAHAFPDIPGKPEIGLDGQVYGFPVSPTGHGGPVWFVAGKATIGVGGGVRIGPRIAITEGSILPDRKNKMGFSGGLTLFAPF